MGHGRFMAGSLSGQRVPRGWGVSSTKGFTMVSNSEDVRHGELAGKRVAILVADGFEQVEMTSPRDALHRAGAGTQIVSLKRGTVQGMNHHEKGDRFTVDLTVDRAGAEDFDALLLPGGVANPDQLRTDDRAVGFV